MAILSLLDLIVLLIALSINFNKLLLACILAPLVVLFSSLYEIYQEKRHGERQMHFQIPADAYQVDCHLTPGILKGVRMKSTTGILWDGKLIIMPQPFVCDGDGLDVVCSRERIRENIFARNMFCGEEESLWENGYCQPACWCF